MVQKNECRDRGDWVRSPASFLLAWGLPVIAMIGGGFLDPLIRAAIWTVALIWMGGACSVNARHCNRTHCKFTGPFFFVMAVPVVVLGSGWLSFGPNDWWWLGMFTLLGSAIIWWGSEAIWGKYRS